MSCSFLGVNKELCTKQALNTPYSWDKQDCLGEGGYRREFNIPIIWFKTTVGSTINQESPIFFFI